MILELMKRDFVEDSIVWKELIKDVPESILELHDDWIVMRLEVNSIEQTHLSFTLDK